MNKNNDTKVFYYNHFITPFIADTVHLDIVSEYAYLTLIWEAHEKRGMITNKDLLSLMRRNKDIPTEVYESVLNEFWMLDNEDCYINEKVTADMTATKQHRASAVKGGQSASLKAMTKTDKHIDNYRQIWKAYKGRRLHQQHGIEEYCKAKMKDTTGLFTFDNIMAALKNLKDTDTKYWPMMATFFNDKDGKYWKADNSNIKSNNYMKGIK